MNKIILPLFVISLIACNDNRYSEPSGMNLKVDLQNHLFDGELEYHLNRNINQLMDSIEANRSGNIVDSAKVIHNKTKAVLTYLDELSENMIDINGGRNEDYVPVNRGENIDLTAQFIDNNKGTGLIKVLTDYERFLRSYGLNYSRLVYEPKDISTLRHDPLYWDKDFIQLHFGERNIFEALSSIQYFKTSVLLKESAVLGLLALR